MVCLGYCVLEPIDLFEEDGTSTVVLILDAVVSILWGRNGASVAIKPPRYIFAEIVGLIISASLEIQRRAHYVPVPCLQKVQSG
jgi:hypothetical protein